MSRRCPWPFYRHNRHAVVAFFLRQTGDPEATADLTLETFRAALSPHPATRPVSP
jgi:hypothetical protein